LHPCILTFRITVATAILILEILILFLIGLFAKNYLPSYMNKKGENLATKEDVEEITRKTEEVQKEFREKFEEFSSDRLRKELKIAFSEKELETGILQL